MQVTLELPLDDIIMPGGDDPTGDVSFFVNVVPGATERHDQAGWYFSMTWQQWIDMGKPLGLRIELEGVG